MPDTCIKREVTQRFRMPLHNEHSGYTSFRIVPAFCTWQHIESHLDSIIRTLENLDASEEIKVDNTVINNSLRLVRSIPKASLDYLAQDDIVLTENGTITLLFEKGNQYVSIEVGRNNMNAVIKSIEGLYSRIDSIDLDSGPRGSFALLIRHLEDLTPSLRMGSVIYSM